MRKIINGKLYDTDTATLIGGYSFSEGGDFSHFSEYLYQKKTGELFFHGKGGPMSRYARSAGSNTVEGSEVIIPESELAENGIDIKEWVSEHCDVDDYIKLFGEVSE